MNLDQPFHLPEQGSGLRRRLPEPFPEGLFPLAVRHQETTPVIKNPETLAAYLSRSIVVVESPFGSTDPWVVELNKAYARECMRWCLLHGLVPLASHLLYTQMLDDQDPIERVIGIEAGLRVNAKAASATLVFLDRGVSRGMEMGIERSTQDKRPVHELYLPGWK